MPDQNLIAPWSRICRLTFVFPGAATKVASGWIADKDLVVGAAHSAYDNGRKAEQVRIEAGLDGASRADHATSTQLFIHDAFGAGQGDPSWDLVVIKTIDPFKSTIGWFPFGDLANRSFTVDGSRATIAGYRQSALARYQLTTLHVPDIQTNGRQRLEYNAATHQGMSGSPVWIVDGDGFFWVVGVHTHDPEQQTQAVFVDDERAAWIISPRGP